MKRPGPDTGFRAVVARVVRLTGMSSSDARSLLEAIGVEVARQALVRQQRVVWPRLGAFRPFTTKATRVDLQALKRAGHLHQGAPEAAEVPSMRKLRFRPSKWHALLKGVR